LWLAGAIVAAVLMAFFGLLLYVGSFSGANSGDEDTMQIDVAVVLVLAAVVVLALGVWRAWASWRREAPARRPAHPEERSHPGEW
jgi:fumarate reductase subunit D